jgi:hypothetical protein
MPVQDRSGTATPYSYISAASANQDSQVVKASAGLVYAIQVFNINAAARYLKVYDKATAPTSADTPVKRILIPASGGGGSGGIQIPGGMVFGSGIAFRLTTGIADADATAVASAEILVNIDWK